MNKIKVSLKLKPEDLLITLETKLMECTNAVFFGINSIDNIKDLPDDLRTDDKSIFTYYPIGKLDIEQSKENFKEWVLKKGFGDLIIALTELLISFSSIIDIENKVNRKGKGTINEFVNLIFEPNYSNSKKSFPALIEKIEKVIGKPLVYKAEIISINQIRRCLEHRNGIVRPTDFNTENGIKLKWLYYEVFTKRNGKLKPFKKFDKINNETKLIFNDIHKSVFFKNSEQIKISFSEFNELAHFCQTFGKELLKNYLNKKNN